MFSYQQFFRKENSQLGQHHILNNIIFYNNKKYDEIIEKKIANKNLQDNFS